MKVSSKRSEPPRAASRVLVVDDNVRLAENIAEILEGAGYSTVLAETAEQALQRTAGGNICLLITDFRLPDGNGVDLINMVSRSVGAIPAIVVSGFMDDEMVEAAREAGALEVLPKPVALDRLMTAVLSTAKPSGERQGPSDGSAPSVGKTTSRNRSRPARGRS